MNIEKYTDAIKNCRFCFMCRHLSGIGNVSFTEADTPRVRASMIYGITMYPERLRNADFIDTMYRSDLSRACTRHCVSHFDENSLNLAARADIVEAGLAPEAVKKVAAELKESADWSVSGSGDVLYFVDRYTAETGTVAAAFGKVAAAHDIAFRTVTGGCIGKGLATLGFRTEAAAVARKFADFIHGLKAKVLVVSNPAAYHALTCDYAAFGVKLDVKVMTASEYLLSIGVKASKPVGEVYYLESDFLRNYCDDLPFPKELLKSLGATLMPFGTNDEESYTCGEGAVVLPQLHEELVRKLAEYIAARADHPERDVIAVASPYTKLQLSRYTRLNVKTLEELAAEAL